jgi:glycosyltransferase involved in cell wall biosynthesis
VHLTKRLPKKTMTKHLVSIIIPTKNEVDTIPRIVRSMPTFGVSVELIFVDGRSTDGTTEAIEDQQKRAKSAKRYKFARIALYQQAKKGKWDAVMLGLSKARGDICMIYDADMTVSVDELEAFYLFIDTHMDALVIGSRFIYPQERGAMRLLNHTGNMLFSYIFSLLFRKRITDTLCGTKVFSRNSYTRILEATKRFRQKDPYGDFTLLLGAAKCHMPIHEIPIRYKARVYGETKISRFRDGFKLLIVLFHAVKDFRRR